MESEVTKGGDSGGSGWRTSVEHIFGLGSERIIPGITPGFHLQSYPHHLPTFEPSVHPIGISTMDLNAFLSSLEISGSTLDFVGMPLEIAMDSFV